MGGTYLKIRWKQLLFWRQRQSISLLGINKFLELLKNVKIVEINIITLLAFFITVKILKFIKGSDKDSGEYRR